MTRVSVLGSHITPAVRAWLMETPRFAVAATVRSDGMPSLSAVWFDLDAEHDDVVMLNTRVGRLKERHLRRDARLSLCVVEDYKYVTIEGRAELDDDRRRADLGIQDLARRYGQDPARYAGQERVTIKLHVERVIIYE